MIELRNVTKLYPGQSQPAVDDESLIMENGEITVLVGPSGCGKSTTIRLVNGMIETTSGDVFVEGQNIKDVDPNKLRMDIGYVIQQIGLLPHRTIAQNIAIVPKLHGWDKARIEKRTLELLELMGLDPAVTKDKYPLQLSGGQMQRVGVARAMAVDPPIMLMDEPFGAVDPITRRGLQDEFLRLQQEMKKTICFVTHDINEAIKMGDKIAIMNKGKIVQFDTPKKILSNPKNDFIKDFIGADRMVKKLNIFPAEEILFPYAKMVKINESELANAFVKMHAHGDRAALYVDQNADVIGLITDDMYEDLGDVYSVDTLKAMIARVQPASIQYNTSLNDSFSMMLEYDTEYLPVYKEGKMIGTISFKDIRNYVSQKEPERKEGE